ncbi:hypothetical protein Rsub_06879 [Raphidocelis subcapitata]|uniref:Uncharacterized protein n=1 Tax=Raphidocelis subcapitata TaxID=307507 RepID=A0A2V0P7P8_9CHLO|nr:hypothetical protein Rsub_06879 [Raphidocelis subcapitata]|eukprot:GBF93880.1 hypothetical protein Rsub_06879 [Raphidocelis subcapitata]
MTASAPGGAAFAVPPAAPAGCDALAAAAQQLQQLQQQQHAAPAAVDDAFEVAPLGDGSWAILNRVPIKDLGMRAPLYKFPDQGSAERVLQALRAAYPNGAAAPAVKQEPAGEAKAASPSSETDTADAAPPPLLRPIAAPTPPAAPQPGAPHTPPALAALSGGMPGRLGAELAERLVAILRDRAQGGGAASAALDELLAKGNPVAQLVAQLLQAHVGAAEAPARVDSGVSSGSDDAAAAWQQQQQQQQQQLAAAAAAAAAAGQADAVRHMLARLQAAAALQKQTAAAQQLQAVPQHAALDATHLARLSALLRDNGAGVASPGAAAAAAPAALGGLDPATAARIVAALREREAAALAAQQQAAMLAAAAVAAPPQQAALLQLLHEREAFQQQQAAAAMAAAAAAHNPLADALARISAAQAGDEAAGTGVHGALPPAQAQALLSAVQRLGIKLPGVCFSGCGLVHRTRKGRSPRGRRSAQQLARCLHEQGILGGEDEGEEEEAGTASPSAGALAAAAAMQGPNGAAWLQQQLAALQRQPELAAAFAAALARGEQQQGSPPPAANARPMGAGGAPLWRGGRGGTGSMGGGGGPGRGGGRGRGAKRSRDASASPVDVPAAPAEPARSRRKAFVPTRTL